MSTRRGKPPMNEGKTRLCVITPTHWKAFMGGAQYQVKCILDELTRTDRYEITYLANRVAADFRPDSYRIVPIGRSAPRLGYLMHTLPLYRALREARPAVIYQRVACGYTGIAAHYARANHARLIWHVAHDSDVMPGSLIDGRNPLRRLLEKRSVEYAIRHASHIVTQTAHQAALLKANYGRAADAVIPNLHPEPTEPVDKSGPLSVVWIANLKPWKQPDAFVRLARALQDLDNVEFTIVGALMAGPRETAWGMDLMQGIEATPNLRYVGQLDQTAVNALLARAHVFVNTSLHEGFANTIIQAWMRETAVVSLHVDPDEVFSRERVGFHAGGSEERLSELVRRLVTEPELRHEYAVRSRDHAHTHHSVRNARLLAELIDTGRIISDRPSVADTGGALGTIAGSVAK
jgi:glycosyltransferase involved in cell wall biosynthesis